MPEGYSFDEVYKATLDYFQGDELAASTWVTKYALRDMNARYREYTPDDMHRRMAIEFARIENKYRKVAHEGLSDYGKKRPALNQESVYELLKDFKYLIPQGSVMSVLGNPYITASLSNCVVLPEIYDSYGGIFYTDQQMAQLFKRRCGVGIDITTLRPAGQRVHNAAGTTSGAVTFMDRFSDTTREVAQHGRRGALMITMDIAHPDIEDFIRSKQDLNRITGANISVKLTDEFMHAVEHDEEFILKWPVESDAPKIIKKVRAKHLWNLIIVSAHRSAEPGLIFWDRQHKYSTSSIYPGFKNVSTNPCSEIAMQGGDSCRLIAINLLSFVNNPFTSGASFDHELFYSVCYEGQRLMDDLVDLELEAIDRILDKVMNDPEPDHIKDPEIRTWKLLKEMGARGRRTGLGFTALADMLAATGYKFGETDSIHFIEEVMRIKCTAEFDSSIDMAIERGAFHEFDPEIEKRSEFILMMQHEFPEVFERMMKYGRRNISLSTLAPTGSLSIMAGTSSGIEPVFMLRYKRRRKVDPSMNSSEADFIDASGDRWQEHVVLHHGYKKWSELDPDKRSKENPYEHSTASEVNWKDRLNIQAVVQKYVTHSISSTINLPAEVPVDVVSSIYLEAWKLGLKGITVYREGSRTGVLVSDNESRDTASSFKETIAPKRPMVLDARVIRFKNQDEEWIAFIGILEGRPYEIFTGKEELSFSVPQDVKVGRIVKQRMAGGVKRYDFQYTDVHGNVVQIEGLSRIFNKEYWNYAKLISGILRHGMPLPQLIDLVSHLDFQNASINTWRNGVERALRQFIPSGTPLASRECPECGDPEGLIYEEGCVKCKSCLMSQCG